MPETHKSGFLFRISFTASFTQSTGVPEQLYSEKGSFSLDILFKYKVLLIVIAWPMALCGLSGATTTISPISDITAIKALSPGAEIPSSFVIKIKGLAFFIIYCCEKIDYL
jgi:hypothetical protein